MNIPVNVQVNFLMKIVALKPGKTLKEMIKNVFQGKDEGADRTEDEDERPTGIRSVPTAPHYKRQ